MNLGVTGARVVTLTDDGLRQMPLETFVKERTFGFDAIETADDAAEMVSRLRGTIVGQDGALDALEAALRVQPEHDGSAFRAIVLFEGPSGSGKTSLVTSMFDDDVTKIVSGAQEHENVLRYGLAGIPDEVAAQFEEGAQFPSSMLANAAGDSIVAIDRIEHSRMAELQEVGEVVARGVDHQGEALELGETLLAGTVTQHADHVAAALAQSTGRPVTIIPLRAHDEASFMQVMDGKLEELAARARKNGLELHYAPETREHIAAIFRESDPAELSSTIQRIRHAIQLEASENILSDATHATIEPRHIT